MSQEQEDLFGTMFECEEIVNVASVPQRSPFRYPGGKTWLVPQIRAWLRVRGGLNKELIEPFAGGGIVSLTAIMENLVGRATMVELDEDVASVWLAIVAGHGKWLADRITRFSFTPQNVKRSLSSKVVGIRDRAFQTILKNRITRGGILAPGAGVLKYGENGRGISSRWYPTTLRKRILAIDFVRDRISAVHGDGLEVMEASSGRSDVVYFVDPPYTAAGKRLYRYSEIDHKRLFDLASGVCGDFLMTYDDANEIRRLAHRHKFAVKMIKMKTTHHSTKDELLIGRDLTWLKG